MSKPETAEVIKPNAGTTPALNTDVDWANVQWTTVVEESGTQMVFDTVGDSFTGLFTGKRTAQADGEDFMILSFRGTDGEAYQTNAGWKLRAGFEDIEPGTIVRMTYVKDVDTVSPTPMKDFRIDVASI